MGLLSKDRIVARPDTNRWLMVPAALAINLSVGQAYAFSVFNLPLSRAIGITEAVEGDWKLTTLGWIFTLAYVFLGLSAGFAGKWQERVGPRVSGVVAAVCWSGGFLLSAVGVYVHQIWLLYVGYGVLGGCGLGIGFTTPISTLIRWFPDRRGMATGMAIMGFGGGALIAAPLSEYLMSRFASATSVGVAETMIVLGIIYFLAMMWGAFTLRLPPLGWRPAGWTGELADPLLTTQRHVHFRNAVRTPQFFLLWTMLLLNVTAGLGVLGQASAMVQEMFPGFSAAAAAGFVGLLSLFNMAGRLFWASLSDEIGRKATYGIFFLLGPILYALVPWTGHNQSIVLFVACFAVIMTMYGGGFATLPAYIADLFGTAYVGAIHGRLLTALSVAGVLGPVLVNYLRQYQIQQGLARSDAYTVTMYIMAVMLALGFFCNLAVSRVEEGLYMSAGELETELRAEQRVAAEPAKVEAPGPQPQAPGHVQAPGR